MKKKNIDIKQEDYSSNVVKSPKKFSYLTMLIAIIFIIGLFYLYAKYIGPYGFKVNEYDIINQNIPSSFDGFSIVQFSDTEFGSTFSVDKVSKLVDEINKLNPDIVVFTGDFAKSNFNINTEERKTLIEKLSKIDALIGKYTVRGDDDYQNSLYDEVLLSSGFKDITNSYELIYYKGLTPIVIYGLGSLLNNNQDFITTFAYPGDIKDTTYMATYRILLAHEPDTFDDIEDYNISLMLSGHSHNSEINIPYLKNIYHIKGATKYYDAHYNNNGTDLYISSGLGTSKYGLRLFAKPSISLFRLYTD